jgi:hypothetical protein
MPWWRSMREWRYCSTILDLSTRWRSVVSFRHQLLYPWEKSTQYPSDRRLGGPQSRSKCCGEERNLAPARNWGPVIQPVDHCYTDWSILLCSPLQVNQCFGGSTPTASCSFLAWLILRPWRWSWYLPPKCWLTFNRLYSVISQKIELYTDNVSFLVYLMMLYQLHKYQIQAWLQVMYWEMWMEAITA